MSKVLFIEDDDDLTGASGGTAFAMQPVAGRKSTGLPAAFDRYKARRQWVARNSKKVPINPATGRAGSSTDQSTWSTYEEAEARARRDNLPGVGLVLTPHDGLTGIDLDNCFNPVTGEWTALAAEMIGLAETYWELSPSGRGLRSFFEGKVARTFTFKDGERGVEVYRDKRYLTVTGHHVPSTPDAIGPAPKTLERLLAAQRAGGLAAECGLAAHTLIDGGDDFNEFAPPTAAELAALRVNWESPSPTLDALCRACAQAQWAADFDNQPQVTETQWHGLIGLVRHCEDGRAAAHRCSKKHPDYSAEETDEKIDRHTNGGFGPTTCGKIAELFGAARCRGCSHAGNPKSSPLVPARRLTANDSADSAGGHAQASDTTVPVSVRYVPASSFAGLMLPPRPWLVRDMIPDRQVTLFGGDGGVGKSLLALQLAVAVATGTDWLGTTPAPGPVLYLSAEDEEGELHRRLADIVGGTDGVSLDALTGLHVVPLAGRDAVLAAPAPRSEIIAATPLWTSVLAKIIELRPRLVVIDNLADAFAGNENSRPQARQFVNLLRGPAVDHELAVVLLGHPSLTGMKYGTGTSGSTAWNNSVRSRLYLERMKGDGGIEPDPNLRVLRVMKANYSAIGSDVRVRWEGGRFKLNGPGFGALDRMAADQRAEVVFLEKLSQFHGQGRNVSTHTAGAYAPRLFAATPGAAGINKEGFRAAMERLFAAGKIAVEQVGFKSKRRERIVAVP